MDLMLDLETLGVRQGSAIIEIGAVPFEAKSGGKILESKPIQLFVKPKDSARMDISTIFWWFNQKPKARERFFKNYPHNFMTEKTAAETFIGSPIIQELGGWKAINTIWANGASFDPPILEALFQRNGFGAPWKYNAVRDTRTLFELAGGVPHIDSTGLIQHSAVGDCVWQAMAVQKAMAILKGN